MSYILKKNDINLLTFDMYNDLDGLTVKIISVDNNHIALLPLDLKPNETSLRYWLKNRTVPSNRAYVDNFLAKCGLNEKDTVGIINLCRGLSLNDCYWVVPDTFTGTFADNNLYDNPISRTIASLAFTGYGSYHRPSFHSSPEFTNNGMLAKCWRRINGRIVLYKSGTEGFANAGNEPYSEFYAYQVAQTMGLNAVPYGLSNWKGRLCSVCELFTSKDNSYIPTGRIVTDGGIKAVIEYYKSLGDKYYCDLMDMFLFDAVICNEDRHFSNFGFLVDNATNEIADTAPIFDNGLSLFYSAMPDDIKNLESYAVTRRPAAYNDFMSFTGDLLARQKEMLRSLIGFRFRKHSKYNLPDTRLKAIEAFIQKRVARLLD